MKSKAKLISILVILGLFCILPNTQIVNVSPNKINNSDDSIIDGPKLKSGGFWNLDLIHIDGNWSAALLVMEFIMCH